MNTTPPTLTEFINLISPRPLSPWQKEFLEEFSAKTPEQLEQFERSMRNLDVNSRRKAIKMFNDLLGRAEMSNPPTLNGICAAETTPPSFEEVLENLSKYSSIIEERDAYIKRSMRVDLPWPYPRGRYV